MKKFNVLVLTALFTLFGASAVNAQGFDNIIADIAKVESALKQEPVERPKKEFIQQVAVKPIKQRVKPPAMDMVTVCDDNFCRKISRSELFVDDEYTDNAGFKRAVAIDNKDWYMCNDGKWYRCEDGSVPTQAINPNRVSTGVPSLAQPTQSTCPNCPNYAAPSGVIQGGYTTGGCASGNCGGSQSGGFSSGGCASGSCGSSSSGGEGGCSSGSCGGSSGGFRGFFRRR